MANQTITVSTNHDSLTGRNAGEDITVQQGAVLTIDSMPHLTTMGILGDILLTEGEVHIDGRYVREVVYSSGSGALPSVGAALTYGTSGTAKVIRLNSGNNAAGTMTITIQGALEEPNGTITDGTWSATVDSSRVGLLIVFGEDQIWDATDATCTLRITGDWYEIGTGTGANNQSITLPHSGQQHAVWVETGNGTGVFEIWHRVSVVTSSVFWDAVADWGSTYESGFVFSHAPGTSTLNFGTSTNGGAPPNGARIRIPNVHMGTTTTGAPTTEINSLTLTTYAEIVDSDVTENVFIDHLNASTVQVSLVQTNGATISDSAIGLWSDTNFINRNNAAVTLTNCAFISGNQLTGDRPGAQWIILDNVGEVIVEDCVFYAGTNANTTGCINLTTMANLTFEGTNKIVSNQQDENTFAALRGSVASNIINNGTLLLLNGGIITAAGCVNWQLGDIAWGQLATRGATENSLNILNLTGTDTVTIDSGRYLTGGATIGGFRGAQIVLIDTANVVIHNFGEVDAKLDNGGFGTAVFDLQGITNNCEFRRIFFTNLAASQGIAVLNSCSDLLFENCSSDYADEIEIDGNNTLVKGFHAASGSVGTASGVEDDLVNVVGSIFLDYFKSDTTGAVGLIFNDRGTFHATDVSITSGAPIWNGLGDMLMRTAGDQVVFTWPYSIKGHTAFQNAAYQVAGVNTGNFDFEYDIDTGSGFSGSWTAVTGANLSGETISASGFRIKIRITCNTSSLTNSLRGFAILTDTTIASQKSNLYPLSINTITLTGLQPNSEVRLYLGDVSDPASATFIDGVEDSGTTLVLTHSNAGSAGYIVIAAVSYENFIISYDELPNTDQTIPVSQRFDRNYENL